MIIFEILKYVKKKNKKTIKSKEKQAKRKATKGSKI
jgi:hypothetical protein